ncbi:hypothetical protein [Metabacillus sp. Hm71]|uniref:hypothetical protein n=1 Tax=Metabacillus sp. Hm71 TaxID=3450743 RepID=UPI003F424C1E
MNWLSFVYAMIFGLVISFIGGFLDFPEPLVSFFVIIIIAYFLIYPIFRLYWGTGDVEKIEQLLLKNKKYPFYRFYYGIANGIEKDVDESIRKINQGFHLPSVKKQHQLIHAYFHEQPEEMEKILNGMRKSAFTLYYQAARSILINDFEGARSYIKQNPKMWMQEALTTELLVKENRKEDAFNHARNALSKTKGIQRYVLLRSWEREWGMTLN